MMIGPRGVGKRAMARWMAEHKLGRAVSTQPEHREDDIELPDLALVRPEEEKTTIGIDQIRGLIASTGLTSYEGTGKAAIIEPANAMTREAANSLLKTLEEPPGDMLIILVADRTGAMPATIFSRCQQVGVAVPAEDVALDWLHRLSSSADWRVALDFAGGAPLVALELLDSLDVLKEMASDFTGVAKRSSPPTTVAAKWAKLDTPMVLDWLSNQVLKLTKARSGCEKWAGVLALDNSVLQRMDTRKLICYLDIINRLRASPKGSFNVQLMLERLLIDWADGLGNVSWHDNFDGLSQIQATG